jgi:hypothetical protein
MKIHTISFWCMILLFTIGSVSLVSGEKENSTTLSGTGSLFWEVVNVTEFRGDKEISDDPSMYGPFTYSNISNGSMVLSIGLYPDELILNGTISPDDEFVVKTPAGGKFMGSVDPGDESVLTFYPVNKSHHYVFDIRKTDESNLSSGNTAVFYSSSLTDKLLMAGVSSGLSGTEQQKSEADAAWISGNEVFSEKPAIECNDEGCSCEGEICTCSGRDCQAEGSDIEYTGDSTICTGYDCFLSCSEGSDCKISTK